LLGFGFWSNPSQQGNTITKSLYTALQPT
jgi:hypothetical protein